MTIYVDNLVCTATANDIRQLFAQYGSVSQVHLIADSVTGRMCGFGFVDMPDTNQAQAAIAGLHGTKYANLLLTVREARPHEAPSCS